MNTRSSESSLLHSLLTRTLLPGESTMGELPAERLPLHVVEAKL
jgi:hypothetical protein